MVLSNSDPTVFGVLEVLQYVFFSNQGLEDLLYSFRRLAVILV